MQTLTERIIHNQPESWKVFEGFQLPDADITSTPFNGEFFYQIFNDRKRQPLLINLKTRDEEGQPLDRIFFLDLGALRGKRSLRIRELIPVMEVNQIHSYAVLYHHSPITSRGAETELTSISFLHKRKSVIAPDRVRTDNVMLVGFGQDSNDSHLTPFTVNGEFHSYKYIAHDSNSQSAFLDVRATMVVVE